MLYGDDIDLPTEGQSCHQGRADIHVILDEEFYEESSAWEAIDHVASELFVFLHLMLWAGLVYACHFARTHL